MAAVAELGFEPSTEQIADFDIKSWFVHTVALYHILKLKRSI